MVRLRARRPVAFWLGGLLATVAAAAAVTGLIALLDPYVAARSIRLVYVLAIMLIAIVWGTGLGALTALLSAFLYTYFFLPPLRTLRIADPRDSVGLIVFLITAVVVGQLASRMRRKAQESARLAEEQSALRRVATLAVRTTSPQAVFEAVTREVGVLCGADAARLERYEADGYVTGVAAWGTLPGQLAVGTRFVLDGPSVARGVRQTWGPVRIDSFTGATGAIAEEARTVGIRSSVGCPIIVGGRLWGVIAASRKSNDPFPPNTEVQIAHFTEIVAIAIANADSRQELAASRARVIAAGDAMRLRLERDLHDGVQQRLIALAMRLRMVQEMVTDDIARADLPALRDRLGELVHEHGQTLEELRELSRGIHPAILSRGGLGPALRTLARRSTLPVKLKIGSESRYPPPVEVAAYHLVSEALTNAVRHARASEVEVTVEQQDRTLRLSVRDDGVGGAAPYRGSGLTGLRDRAEAIGGTISIASPVGQGTRIDVSLPLEPPDHTTPRQGFGLLPPPTRHRATGADEIPAPSRLRIL